MGSYSKSDTLDSIITSIKQYADSQDEFGRARLQHALREVQFSMETPFESVMRMSIDTVQVTIARVAADLGLFKYLVESGASQTATALAKHFGTGESLMTRILRYASSVNMVREIAKDTYVPSNITQSLAIPGYEAGIHHAFDNLCPTLLALPNYLAETKYQDITSGQSCVFQKAFNTDQHAFMWIAHQPARLANFQVLMTVERSPNWLSTFPMDKYVDSWSAGSDKALFVDIGAGLGQGCTQIRDKYPNVPGKIVLQELPPFIQVMPPIDRVELMAYNFFTPQPVVGAKFYFLRLILRDYPDDVAIAILKNIVPAMADDSCIIIDDGVVPEEKPCWDETGTDICIMSSLGSKERTQNEWKALADEAGLVITAIYPYTSPVVNATMVLKRK